MRASGAARRRARRSSRACAAGGVRRLVLASSAAAHGAGAGPASAYGTAKRATEERVRAAFAPPGRGHAVLRCFNVAGADPALRAGPRLGQGLVQAACEAALGLREDLTLHGTDWETADGTCVRDYVHASDVAAAHVAALGALERGARKLTADVGTGRGHSVREVLAAVGRASGNGDRGARRAAAAGRRGVVGGGAGAVGAAVRLAGAPRLRRGGLDRAGLDGGAGAGGRTGPRAERGAMTEHSGTGSRAAGAANAAPAPRGGYKRPFDLVLLGLAVLVLAPLWALLALAIALAIRLEDGGPALYRQARLGRGGAVFEILKFRTMAVGAEARTGPVWTARGDARITRVGRALRRFHLDELPQAVNVLRGEMSLVGPRPERPELAAHVEREVPGFSARLRVRPGLAGLAQAEGAGWRDPALKLRYDMRYIAAMSPWLDLRLCARCLARTLGPRRGRPR